MKLTDLLKIALEGISTNKVRSLLTALGVIIGVATVILLISIGEGVKYDVTSQIEGLGSNLLIVVPGSQGKITAGKRFSGTWGGVNKLKFEYSEIIKKKLPEVGVSPLLANNAMVKYKNNSSLTQITGITPKFQEVRNHYVESGRFINNRQIETKKRVCVLGKTVVKNLFQGANPIGKFIKIKGVKFLVIGVMRAKGYLMQIDFDDQIFVPLTTAQNLFGNDNISMIYIQTPSSQKVETISKEVRRILLKHLEEDDFVIHSQEELLSAFQSILSILTIMLGSIAGISLLVGGIGIMNIMLVSVTERIKEIGLRKAIGATEEDILMQFLLESITLSIIGGTVGIMLGSLGSVALSNYSDLHPKITIWAIILAFGVSTLVGVFFGVYPASKAANQDAIVALRYE